MNDQSIQIQMVAEKFHRFVLDYVPSEPDDVSKQVNKKTDSMDESTMSQGIHQVSPDKGHTLPILKKILDLDTKIQDLKKHHIALSDEVRAAFPVESFPGTDVLKSVQLLGMLPLSSKCKCRLVQVNHPCYIQSLEKCSLFVALFIPMNPLFMYHRSLGFYLERCATTYYSGKVMILKGILIHRRHVH
ncbi:uncharacterized protein LOC114183669 isoform X2 [Vigna unguiculata]|uniref:uncharacterized protein LOC114183669 isoform X2 n=1 Tax=Vigna unguiculata TaxID=3917 RepID=UPI0010167AC4|nr:uncharacterized protein LOC114183669 isoform X2 [Vigna unguiculata]